ncbi:MAG: hypothetical protein SFW67_18140 [Myxococcaceae bacterium]|nr:hypothetical protein [Myxococcaceae bacterium]
MPIATTTLRYVNWLKLNPQNGARLTDSLDAQTFERLLTSRRVNLGTEGIAAIRALYAEASVNGPPTYAAFKQHIERVERRLGNERAPGRVNDGFVDAHEARLLQSRGATATFEFLEARFPATLTTGTGATATTRQLDVALATLVRTVDAAFRSLPASPAPDFRRVVTALRTASASADLPKPARDAITSAANAVTGRGAGGSLTEAGATPPTASGIKAALRRAHAALRSADGAVIVDLSNPQPSRTSKRDGVVSELEVSRTRSAQGKTARALFEFAGSR